MVGNDISGKPLESVASSTTAATTPVGEGRMADALQRAVDTPPQSLPSLGPIKVKKSSRFRRFMTPKWIAIIVGVILLLVAIGVAVVVGINLNNANNVASKLASSFSEQQIPLDNAVASGTLNLSTQQSLSINGQLNANNTLVISPTGRPSDPVIGQIYLDSNTKKINYYNGTTFISLVGTDQTASLQNQIRALQNQVSQVQIPANLAKLDAANKFTANNSFSGDLTVSGSTALGPTSISSLVLSNALPVSSGGTGNTSLQQNGILIGQGTSPISAVSTTTAGLCLVSTTGAPEFQICPGGGGGGVTSLDGLNGALTLANSTGSGTTITINNAGTATKGIAQFNASNFTVTTGIVNTVQNIAVTSTPTFGGLTLNGNLLVGGNSIVTSGATISASELNVLDNGIDESEVTGVITDVTAGNGLTGGASSGNATLNVASANGGIVVNSDNIALTLQPSADALSTTISSGSGLEILGGGITLLQGCGDGQLLKWDETNDVWYCANDASGVTGSGSTNQIAKFTSGSTVGNSSLTDNGVNVTTSVDLVIQGGNVTAGTGTQLGSFILNDGNGQTTTLRAGDSASNLTFILPTSAGTAFQCLKYNTGGQLIWDDCAGGGGGSGVSSLNSLSGSLAIQGSTQIGVSALSPNISLSINANSIGDSELAFDTGQNLTTTSTPTFAGLTLNGDVSIASNNIVTSGAIISASELNVLDNGIDESEVAGVITDVTAGSGLTGGAASGNATLNVVSANGGISVGADNIALTLQPSGSGLSTTTSSGSGLEILSGGLTLLQGCSDSQILKYSTTTNTWDCAADAGGTGVGDDVLVNSTNATGANFVDTTASGTTTGVAWSLNTVPSPDNISLTVSNASGTQAGSVTTGVQDFGGDKTFNNTVTVTGLFTANGGITLQTGGTLTVNGTGITDLVGTGLTVSGGALQTTLGTSIDSSEIVDGTITGTDIANDTIALGTKTTGNYAAGATAGTGIAVTGTPGEGWSPTISFDYSSDLTTNSLGVNQSSFASTGILFEGTTADGFETLLTVSDPTADNTITLPNASGTVCLDSGNCAGAGGGVTTAGGTTNTLAKFSGSQAIANSTITDDGTNVTTSVNLIIQGGNVTAGTGTQLGSFILNDGNGQTTTLRAGDSASNLTFILPTSAGSQFQCLKYDTAGQLIWDNCDGGAGGGSGVLSLNGLTGGVTIQGDSQIGVSAASPNINLSINANSIGDAQLAFDTGQNLTTTSTPTFGGLNVNGNVVVGANSSLTLTGGTTANRPASPTEGMLFYDTTTKQLLVYSNGKWQADRESNTKIIAPSNASQAAKDAADVVLTGTADQTAINTALTAAAGGKVYIMEGTVTVTGSINVPNNTTLAGAGRGTLITVPNTQSVGINLITNTDTTTGTGVVIQNLQIDGNSSGSTGLHTGIRFSGMGGGTGASARQGGVISRVWANNCGYAGLYLNNASNNTITNTVVLHNQFGILLSSSSNNNTLTGNMAQGNTSGGISLITSSAYNTVTGNTAQGNASGIYLSSAAYNTVTGNTSQGNTSDGIYFSGATNNTITGNTVSSSGRYGIFLTSTSTGNTVSGNNAQSNTLDGIYINSSSNNAITSNSTQSNGAAGITIATSTGNNISSNNTQSNTTYGIYLSSTSSNNTVTGNSVISNTSFGIYLSASDGNTIDGNKVHNNGAATTNNGIYVASNSNTITSNNITDTSATTNNYAINVASGSANYLASNTLGTGSIRDVATGTIYGGQVDSSSNYILQPATAGSIQLMNSTTISSNLTVTSAGNVAFQRGGNYSTTGISNNVNFGTGALFRLTGASAQTITGIANGTDGRIITLINAASQSATISNNSASSTAANRIITGTGADMTLASGASINLIYDSGSSFWRVVGSTSAVGGGTFVNLQATSPGTADVGNFNINGTGIAANLQGSTSVTTPLLDSISGTLSIGTGTASAVSISKAGMTTTINGALTVTQASTFNSTAQFNDNVTVAANKSITLTGGTTANRPASPTEGMLFYDITTKQLLVYANGKWQADRSSNTKIIAPSNASQAAKDSADVVLTGTADQTLINTALTAAAGGKVYILEGTVYVTGSISVPNNTTLAGSGRGTLITIPNSTNTAINIITNTTTAGNGTGVTIRDLQLDGNRANNISGTTYGVYLNGMGSGTGSAAIQGAKVNGLWINNFRGGAVYLIASSNNTISGNTTKDNYDKAFTIDTGANNTVSNNISQLTPYGYYMTAATNNTVVGNSAQGSLNDGFRITTNSNGNTISGNTSEGSSSSNFIVIASSTGNTFTGNTSLSAATDGFAIFANNNTFTGNTSSNGSSAEFDIQADYNTITGNALKGGASGWNGIMLYAANYNIVSNNSISDMGSATNNEAIDVTTSGHNNITGNVVTDNNGHTTDNYALRIHSGTANYLSDNNFDGALTQDAGTGTVYGGQVDSSGNYVIQPAGAINLNAATNVTGNLAVTGTGSFTGGSLTVATTTATDDSIKLQVTSGGANAFTGTLTSADLTAAQTWTLPNESGTICIVGSTSCLAGAGFVQLAPGSAQTDSSTNSSVFINKTGASGNILELQKAGTDVFTINNNGDATFNQNVTVAANKSLTLTGGATASRPASPTEGMLFYDTTTKQLLVYANGKWQADRSTTTKIVAASNSSQAVKDAADYVATGTGDQTQINAALTAAAGGKVYLAEGTYTINGSISIPNNTTLAGAGAGTLITVPASFGAALNAIVNTDTTTGTGVTVQDLRLDGNKATQTNTMKAIYLLNMGSSTRHGAKLSNLWIDNWLYEGIVLDTTADTNIANIHAQGNADEVVMLINSNGNSIANVNAQSNGWGVSLSGSSYNTITGSAFKSNSTGISLSSSNNNSITGNTAQGSGNDGIYVYLSNNNTVSGNTTLSNSQNGINLDTASHNNISSNNSQGNTNAGVTVTGGNNTITGNVIQSNGEGIIFSGVTNTTVSSNQISNNTAQGLDTFSGAGTGNTITGNTFANNGMQGIYLTDSDDTVTGNTITISGSQGIYLAGSSNTVSGNRITDSSSTLDNDAITVAGSSANSITGNTITDGTHTSTNNAITINAGSTSTYLADNTLGGGAISDSGTGTIYGGQVDSSANYTVQPAGSINLNATTNVSGNLAVGGTSTVTTTSTSAFLVQDAGNSALLTADTSAMQVVIGNSGNTITLSSSGITLAGNARHTKKITLTPEYAGAALDAASDTTGTVNCSTSNSGTMTSGYATGITGFGNTTQNYYKWTTASGSNQCYDVVLQVPVPTDFNAWNSSTPITINTYTTDTTNGLINMQVIDTAGTTETSCNYVSATPASASTWTASGSGCTISGTYTAGSYMTIRVRMTSPNGGDTRIGNIVLTYRSSF